MRAAALLLVLLAAGCAPAGLRPGATPAPFEARLLPGGTLRLDQLAGSVVLLDVWATWCVPCRSALPGYARLARELPGLRVVALSIDQGDDEVRRFLAEVPLPVLIARDPGGVLAEGLGVRAMPTAFVLDRAGQVRLREDGLGPGAEERVEAAVRALLAEPAVR